MFRKSQEVSNQYCVEQKKSLFVFLKTCLCSDKSVPYSGISVLTYSHYRVRTRDSIKSIIDYFQYRDKTHYQDSSGNMGELNIKGQDKNLLANMYV